MKQIRVIIKRPDEKVGHVTHINDTLENLQKLVGGKIEVTRAFGGVLIICNEEGKVHGLKRNFKKGIAFSDIIVGPVIVCGEQGDEFGDIPITIDNWKTVLQAWGNEI